MPTSGDAKRPRATSSATPSPNSARPARNAGALDHGDVIRHDRACPRRTARARSTRRRAQPARALSSRACSNRGVLLRLHRVPAKARNQHQHREVDVRDECRTEEVGDRKQAGEARRARQHEQHREHAGRGESGDAQREPAHRQPRPCVPRQGERIAAEGEAEVDVRGARGVQCLAGQGARRVGGFVRTCHRGECYSGRERHRDVGTSACADLLPSTTMRDDCAGNAAAACRLPACAFW